MTKSTIAQKTSNGEMAVGGLFNGLWAGLVMSAYLLVAGLLGGSTSVESFTRLSLTESAEPWMATLTHLAVSAVYGLVYGLVYAFITRRWRWEISWWLALALGALYGLILWLLAVNILAPGTVNPLREITPAVLVGAHLVYGLTLGGLIYRARND
jgi:uncharacterized membrane protein YagU involved in acid resistance